MVPQSRDPRKTYSPVMWKLLVNTDSFVFLEKVFIFLQFSLQQQVNNQCEQTVLLNEALH